MTQTTFMQESRAMLEELASRRDDVDLALIDREKVAEVMAAAARSRDADGAPNGNLAGIGSGGENGRAAPTAAPRGRGRWLDVKRIKNNRYLYLRWREGKTIRSRYICKAAATA